MSKDLENITLDKQTLSALTNLSASSHNINLGDIKLKAGLQAAGGVELEELEEELEEEVGMDVEESFDAVDGDGKKTKTRKNKKCKNKHKKYKRSGGNPNSLF